MTIHIYAEHCEFLEEQNKRLKEEIIFLKKLLDIKTFGLPLTDEKDNSIIWLSNWIFLIMARIQEKGSKISEKHFSFLLSSEDHEGKHGPSRMKLTTAEA